LQRSGQNQILLRGFNRWVSDGHRWNGELFCLVGQGGVLRLALEQHQRSHDHEHDGEPDQHRKQPAPRLGRSAELFILHKRNGLPLIYQSFFVFMRNQAAAKPCRSRRPWIMEKTQGTKKSVANVANSNPPITARPSGAFCSPPSPNPRDMGTMPMIIASAVMMTGRMRTKPAWSAASRADLPSSICSRAKDTI